MIPASAARASRGSYQSARARASPGDPLGDSHPGVTSFISAAARLQALCFPAALRAQTDAFTYVRMAAFIWWWLESGECGHQLMAGFDKFGRMTLHQGGSKEVEVIEEDECAAPASQASEPAAPGSECTAPEPAAPATECAAPGL